MSQGGTMCITLAQYTITSATFFNKFFHIQEMYTMALPWHLAWHFNCHTSCLFLSIIPEQNRTYTTLVPSTVLLYYEA